MQRSIRSTAAAAFVTSVAALILTAAPSVASSSLPTLTLTMTGSGVSVSGATTSGAVNVQAVVSSKAGGGPTLIHLDTGVPFSMVPKLKQMVTAHHGDFNYLDGYASVTFSNFAPKGTSIAGQTVLEPGNYVALNLGSNTAPAAFTVTQSASPATLPTPAATVASIEFNFTGPSTWRVGSLMRFQNDGFLFHMIVGAQLKSKADYAKVRALLIANKNNAANKYLTSVQPTFDAGLSSGSMQQEVLNEPPGWYVITCFMDTQDGRSHSQLGMEKLIHIVR